MCTCVGLQYIHIFCHATLCSKGRTSLPCALQRPHLHTHLPATRACCSGASADTTQQQHDTMGADSHAPPTCVPALWAKPNMAAPGATKRHVYVEKYTHVLIKGKWQKSKYTHALIKGKSRKGKLVFSIHLASRLQRTFSFLPQKVYFGGQRQKWQTSYFYTLEFGCAHKVPFQTQILNITV